mgnify:FL=1
MQKNSNDFYSSHAERYAEVTHGFIQSVYSNVSHPGLTSDLVIMERMRELIPEGARGLDAGCGSGARDVFFYWQLGYDVVGFDAVDENIRVAKELHPEIAEKVSVADLSKPLQHPDESFDFVMCNAVIQHIAPDLVASVTLPELTRVLKPGGVLQLMFKVGDGIKTLYDKDYDAERTFQLYSADDVVSSLTGLGCEIIPQVGEKLGGLMYFTDPKPADHCLLFALKSN